MCHDAANVLQEVFMVPHSRWLAATTFVLASIAVGHAIPYGQPDGNAHPYVGELLFYVPDDVDPRFADPGSWYTCSGTLVSPTVVVTAGHCTYGVGANGSSTLANGGSGDGGNDIWINFREAPDFSVLPPSSNYVPDGNAERYADWSAALDSDSNWVRATASTHPEFPTASFLFHDLGVIVLDEPVDVGGFGAIAPLDYLDRFQSTRKNDQRFTPVGYGLTRSLPWSSEGGDTRQFGETNLVNLKGLGVPDGIIARFSSNNGNPHRGGTCYGDSGGPILEAGTNLIVAVTSFGLSPNCTGVTGGYRIDQQDDLDFLATFGITPEN
jgi:hypothetical protein